jgi:hypothetical protein
MNRSIPAAFIGVLAVCVQKVTAACNSNVSGNIARYRHACSLAVDRRNTEQRGGQRQQR